MIEFGPKITAHRLTESAFQDQYEFLFNQKFDPDDALAFHQYATEKVWLMKNNISVMKGIGGYDIYILCKEVITPEYRLKDKR